MLEARPGSFVFIGNGDTANLLTRLTISTTRLSLMASAIG